MSRVTFFQMRMLELPVKRMAPLAGGLAASSRS